MSGNVYIQGIIVHEIWGSATILTYTWVGTWIIFCMLFSKWQFQKTNQGSEFGTEKDCFAPD